MCNGVRPSLSTAFKSAYNLIKSSTFFSYQLTTAKCNGVAFKPLLIFTSNSNFPFTEYFSFIISKE